jgi:hypothetical protein
VQSQTRRVVGRLAKKLLMPLVVSGVTAAAGYAGKRAPELVERTLMPKLRDADEFAASELDRRRDERAAHRQARRNRNRT